MEKRRDDINYTAWKKDLAELVSLLVVYGRTFEEVGEMTLKQAGWLAKAIAKMNGAGDKPEEEVEVNSEKDVRELMSLFGAG